MASFSTVPTVRVRLKEVPEQEMLINQSDFNPELHEEVVPGKIKPSPKVVPKDGWESIKAEGESAVLNQQPAYPEKSAVTEGSATDKPAAKRVPLKGAR